MSYKYIDIRPNPVTGIGSYQRGFSIKDFVDLPQVEHRRIGGPYKATFRIYADDRNMAEDLLFLGVGREVKIYNDKGIVDFGGMIYVVTLSTGGSKVRSSFLDMSNRVWARWQEAGTANPPDRSNVFDNTASQALYGIKEEVWNAGQQVSVAEASQYAEKQLQEYAWPTPRAVEISPGKKLADRPMLEITCFGWWHTLSHIRYNQTAVAGSISASTLVRQVVGTFGITVPARIKNNLISWWTLDEESAGAAPIIRVDSHRANDLTDNNTVASAAGKVNLSGQFVNAANEALSHVSNADLQTGDIDFTFAFWGYLDNNATTQTFIAKDDVLAAGDREYQIHYDLGTNRFRMQVFRAVDVPVTVVANTLGIPAIATWYFVVGWHDATANTLNIEVNDGGIDSIGTGGALQVAAASGFYLGAKSVALANPLDGREDEVGFWKRVLTAAERTTLYNAGAGVGYSDIGATTRTGGIGQFIRSTDIRANGTLIEQTIDADMGGDSIIKSVVDMGDAGLNTWVAGVDHTREFYYRPGELGE